METHRGIYLNFTLGSLIIMFYELGLKPHVCMRNRTTESDRHNDICGLQKIRVYSRKMVFQLHIYPVIILKLYCLWRYSTTIYIAMLFKKTQSHNNFLELDIIILKCNKHIVLLFTSTKKNSLCDLLSWMLPFHENIIKTKPQQFLDVY